MSVFSEYLTELRDHRGIPLADLAEMVDLDKTVLYHWFQGNHLPESWERILPVLNGMCLTVSEQERVQQEYIRASLGEKKARCFQKITEIMDILHRKSVQRQNPVEGDSYVLREMRMPQKDFVELGTPMDVLTGLQTQLHRLTRKPNVQLQLHVKRIPEMLGDMIERYPLTGENSGMDIVVEWGDGTPDTEVELLETLKELLSILMQGKQVWLHSAYGHLYVEESYLIADDVCMVFAPDLSHGMMIWDPELIAFYRSRFEKTLQHCDSIEEHMYHMEKIPEDFDYSVGKQVMVVEYMPCVSVGMNRQILEEDVYPFLPYREEIINSILKQYPDNIRLNKFSLLSIGMLEGVEYFLQTGMVEGYTLYGAATPKNRIRILENTIQMMREEATLDIRLIRPSFQNLEGVHMELHTGDAPKLLIEIHRDGCQPNQFYVKNRRIQKCFAEYFDFVKSQGFLYSREKSIEMIEQLLENYRATQ